MIPRNAHIFLMWFWTVAAAVQANNLLNGINPKAAAFFLAVDIFLCLMEMDIINKIDAIKAELVKKENGRDG